jgi:multiple sugar transport system permease protein
MFPLYWIITGSLKTAQQINAAVPEWFPLTVTLDNYMRLFKQPSLLWLLNTVIMAVSAMALTCFTAALAGYVLAKKRFIGRNAIFTLMVCAMALPKQVILIPLLKEMSVLGIHNTLLAVILPTVGWPFGVFLIKQFSEGIPTELLEAARIDGAGEWKTFVSVALPIIKPGIGALAIFTFISSWNDYFLQLIMLNSKTKLTISLGIAKMQAEMATDYGIIMAGAALASVPIIIVFLAFQKYFTQGITMGAVKG